MPRRTLSHQAVPLVSSLPTSPVDGQEIDYLADTTGGVIWRLRYRTASASSYKWEYVGGSEMVRNQTGDAGTISTGSFVEPPGSPTLTLPLSGDYFITVFGQFSRTGAGVGNAQVRVSTSSAVLILPGDARFQGSGFTSPNPDLVTVSIAGVATGLAAAGVLRYYVVGGGMTCSVRTIILRPVRVG
jgi:hypothetical protein